MTSSDEPEPNGLRLVSLGPEAEDQNQEGSGDGAEAVPDRTGATQTVGCDVCGRSFKQRYEMRIHRRTHTGERPFSCEVCGKSFMRSSGLTVHMRIHTGHKPYCCRFCGKSFTQLSSLNYHRRTHSGLVPVLVTSSRTGLPLTEPLCFLSIQTFSCRRRGAPVWTQRNQNQNLLR